VDRRAGVRKRANMVALKLVPKFTPASTNLLDWSNVESALVKFIQIGDIRAKAFQRYVLVNYFARRIQDTEECITDGGNDRGIDCVVIDRDVGVVNLISTKTAVEFKNSTKNFPGTEVEKIKSFVDDLMRREDGLIENANPILRGYIRQIWEALENGEPLEIKIHLFSNQSPFCDNDRERLLGYLKPYGIALFEAHLAELSKGLALRFDAPERRQIDFVSQEFYESKHAGARIIDGVVEATVLLNCFFNPDRTALDTRLLHQNVRGNLGVENPVNKNIQKTIDGDDAEAFVLFNNGITIVCERYNYQAGSDFPVHMERPQIVNGGQTAASLVAAGKTIGNSLEKVKVRVRVIESRDELLVQKIAFATNSQSKILDRDLRANDDISLKLAVGLNSQGYYYRRKRGETGDIGQLEQSIDALRTAQMLLATRHGEPHGAKTKTSSIFGEEFSRVFDPAIVTPQLLIELNKLSNEIDRRRNSIIAKLRASGGMQKYDEHWIVEGAFHVAWLAFELAVDERENLVRTIKARSKIDQAISHIDKFYKKLERVSAYRLFRTAQTVVDIKRSLQLINDNYDVSDQPDLFH
jgi:hypothetical protein